jgi:hypothetical protein
MSGGQRRRKDRFDLTPIFHGLPRQLFPALQAELGPLTALDRQFCEGISLPDLGRFTQPYEWCGEGPPPCPRVGLAHAFSAKSVYPFPTTGALIHARKPQPTLRRLCGWERAEDVPSEPTFSRAFAECAADQLPQRIHEHRVKLHAGPKLVGHVSRDATAIEAPERPAPKPAGEPKVPRKRGRPKKGEERPAPPPKRLEAQLTRSSAENLADLPTRCDVGCKRNSKGHQESWIGSNPRGGEKIPFAPAQARRFGERSASERGNSLLQERDGARWVRVRGAAKVRCQLMFGLVALTATALFARLC